MTRAGSHGAPELQVRLVGGFAVHRGGRELAITEVGDRKARTLLALLAVEAGRTVPVDRIVDALWADAPPRRPPGNVATLVSRLRSALGPLSVLGARSGYRLGDAIGVDLQHADDLVAEAEARAASGEPALVLAAAHAALDLLGGGTVLADEPDAHWADPARRHHAALLRRARLSAAEAGLQTGDIAGAVAVAGAAVEADPLDESACRAVMRAFDAAGEPGRALAAYERLRVVLAAELGIDPARPTRDLHLAILREEVTPMVSRLAATPGRVGAEGVIGRDREVKRLAELWRRAVAGEGAFVLIAGEAGIGKTTLADEAVRLARATGGLTLEARCYDAERSLFLQPVVEALTRLVSHLPRTALRDAAADRAGALAAIVPEVATILGEPLAERGSAAAERRRAYDAVTVFLRRLAVREPVVLVLDDLHNAGVATIELLHYLARHVATGRILVVATVRSEEGDRVLATLAKVSERLDVGPLDAHAIGRLAAAAGQEALAGEIERRTCGHTLFVVETLRGLAAGESGMPDSLRASVVSRVRRAGPQAEELLSAAAVLGSSFMPATLAGLLDIATQEAARRCDRILQTRLTVVAGRAYEFANDLIQEALYDATPAPTRLAYHFRAADLLADQPEAMARHAEAAEDWNRAGQGWLAAGERAEHRYAVGDAEALVARAIETAHRASDVELEGRAYLARGRVREAVFNYDDALSDHMQARRLALVTGDRHLEMRALRELAGPAWAGAGRPVAAAAEHLAEGLDLAVSLGDRTAEAELLAWSAVLSVNRLRFDDALAYGLRALSVARTTGDDAALAAALDGLKSAYAYQGEVAPLRTVLGELEPLCRSLGDLWLMQWCVFESAFPMIARGQWQAATARVEEALALNRRSGYTGYESWYVSNLGWLARLQGHLEDALEHGKRALRLDAHAWWSTASVATYATTLLEVGQTTEAVALLEQGLAGCDRHGTEAYRVPCLAGLAEATGSRPLLDEADAMVRAISAPRGSAWLLGADTYVAIARAWLNRGEPGPAAEILVPLLTAADRTGWTAPLAPARSVAARCMDLLGRPSGR